LNQSDDLQSGQKSRPALPDTPVPALARGAAILDFISKASQPVSAQKIGVALKLPKSSVHNLCATMIALEMIIKRNDQTYVIGPHIMRWARSFSQHADVSAEFTHVLDETAPFNDATLTLSILEQNEVMIIGMRNSGALARAGFRIGGRLPLAYSASGKAFLSHIPDAQIERMFESGLPDACTQFSIRPVDALISQVRRCRIQGFSVDDQEVNEGIVSIASTVLDFTNQPVAAISISMASHDQRLENRQNVISSLKQITEQVSTRLGADLGD